MRCCAAPSRSRTSGCPTATERASIAIVDVGAAPHCPAGHFSPYSDGEKDAASAPGLTGQKMFFTEKKHLPPLSE
ncbi:MAG: hypothetical protein EOS09_17865 [Mesorhizobium sp.]|nr:MAG: hypothetical protein EOS09_17865 [Mesorhizobium sp.]